MLHFTHNIRTITDVQKKIYLDFSATTPLLPEVFEAMKPYFFDKYGNASSIHYFGQEARRAIDKSREILANILGASPEEIYFVSGGTEASNLAIRGVAYGNLTIGNHIITSQVEHDSVLNVCRVLEKEGFDVTYLPVDRHGMVNPLDVANALNAKTILISIIHGNNEIGTINPIDEIGKIAHDAGIYFHTDAIQSFGKVPIDVNSMNISLMSISGHKIYGPKGVGALYVRNNTKIKSLFYGGSHESGLRPGTENVPSIVGLAKAADSIFSQMIQDQTEIGALRDYFENELKNRFRNVLINGHPEFRLYNNLNVSFPDNDSEQILLHLNKNGIAASNGSACHSGSIESSHVLKAIGLSPKYANSAIRFSLGRYNTKEEIDYVVKTLLNMRL